MQFHRQWIGRMLANLQSLFDGQGNRDDLLAMTELWEALNQSPN